MFYSPFYLKDQTFLITSEIVHIRGTLAKSVSLSDRDVYHSYVIQGLILTTFILSLFLLSRLLYMF